jgi:hypothetical protein
VSPLSGGVYTVLTAPTLVPRVRRAELDRERFQRRALTFQEQERSGGVRLPPRDLGLLLLAWELVDALQVRHHPVVMVHDEQPPLLHSLQIQPRARPHPLSSEEKRLKALELPPFEHLPRTHLHGHATQILLNVISGHLAVLIAEYIVVKLAGQWKAGDALDAQRVRPGDHLLGEFFVSPPIRWVHCTKIGSMFQ